MYRYYVKEHGKKRMVEYPKKEVVQLAELIGIDFESETQYRWFLHQALSCLLPIGWKRESDPLGNVQYHNIRTQVTTKNNPLIYKFRKCFERLIEKDLEANFAGVSKITDGKNPENQKTSQDIVISSYEDQQNVFQKLMSKVSKVEIPYSEKFQQILQESEEFYEMVFLDNKPPKTIIESLEYQLVSPDEMYEFSREYGFSNHPELFWIARVALVLPLPPLWKEELDALGNRVFINSELNYPQTAPPYHGFLVKFIQRLKENLADNDEKIMTFYDKNSVRYLVDLTKLNNKKDYIVLKDPVPDPEFLKKALYFKPQLTSDEALTDTMIFEIAQSIGIDFNKEFHLVSAVYQIIQSLKNENILKNWDFRITMEGNRYWYNIKEKRSVNTFPYKEDIKKYVRVVRKEVFTNAKSFIRPFQDRNQDFKEKGKDFYEKCRKEALSVTEALLKNLMGVINKQIPENFQASSDIKDILKKKDLEEYYDLIFACPFSFGHQIPDINNGAANTNSSSLSIDAPFQSNRISSRATEEQIESIAKLKLEKDPEKEFLRGDRDRRKTINLDSIEPEEKITEFRKFNTIRREEEGVIEEIDSSEESSKSAEAFNNDSHDSNDYEELKNIVDSSPTERISRISTVKLSDSKKNTIQSIIGKERRRTLIQFGEKSIVPTKERLSADNQLFKEKLKDIKKFHVEDNEYSNIESSSASKSPDSDLSVSKSFKSPNAEIKPGSRSPYSQSNSVSKFPNPKPIDAEILKKGSEHFQTNPSNYDTNNEADDNPVVPEKNHSSKSPLKINFEASENQQDMDFSSISSEINGTENLSENSLVNIEIEKNNDRKFSLENPEKTDSLSHPSTPVVSIQSYERNIETPVEVNDISNKTSEVPNDNDPIEKNIKSTELPQKNINSDKLTQKNINSAKLPQKNINSAKLPPNKTESINSRKKSVEHRLSIKTTKEPQVRDRKITTPRVSMQNPKNIEIPQITIKTDLKPNISIKSKRISIKKNLENIENKEEKSEIQDNEDRKDIINIPTTQFDDKKITDTQKLIEKNTVNIQNNDPEYETNHKYNDIMDVLQIPRKNFQQFLPPKLNLPENLEVFSTKVLRMPRIIDTISSITPKITSRTKLDPIEDKKNLNVKAESIQSLKKPKKEEIPVPINSENISTQKKLFFLYYLELIGHPNAPRFSLNFFDVPKHVQPIDVINMNKRLDIRVSSVPYSSIESDFAWIGYLQIAAPMPNGFNPQTRVFLMLDWPLGAHPGDTYFSILFQYQKSMRSLEMKKLTKAKKIESILGLSWARFLTDKNKIYYYNFLTAERSDIQPNIHDLYDYSYGPKKANKLKDMLKNDEEIQRILEIYGLQESYSEDKHSNFSNHVIQSILKKEISSSKIL